MKFFKLTFLIAGIIFSLAVFSLNNTKENISQTFKIQNVEDGVVDEAALISSILSVRSEKKILHKTSVVQYTTSSSYQTLGMEAKLTQSYRYVTQYFVDLSSIKYGDVFISGNKVVIKISKESFKTYLASVTKTNEFDNDSWLFSFSKNVRSDLGDRNKKKSDALYRDAVIRIRNAEEDNAKKTLVGIFSIPVKALNLNYTIDIQTY